MKKKTAVSLVLIPFLLLSAAPALCRSAGFSFPSKKEVRYFDLDRDGRRECFVREKQRLTVIRRDKEIWKSPREWRVSAFVLGDATNDGRDDLCLVVWKKGSFGNGKPFWVKENDESMKNHLFIFNLEEDRLKPIWMSSNLDNPIKALHIEDSDGDGKKELVVSEGRYGFPGFLGTRTTTWQWSEWGFKLLEEPGRGL
jgi:hypothetical protein